MHTVGWNAYVALIVLWLVLMVLIVTLNLPLGCIFWYSDQLKAPRNMYIASMIVSDLLLAAVIPAKVWVLWTVLVSGGEGRGPETLCRGIMQVQTFLIFVNLYSVLALALVRHRYITSMGKVHQHTRREATYFLAFIWTASLVCSMHLPYLMKDEQDLEIHPDKEYICSSLTVFVPSLVVYEFLTDFCLPIGTIYLLCAHAQQHLTTARACRDPVVLAASRKRDCRVVRMVCIIANCFLLFHLPLHILNIVDFYHQIHLALGFEICQLLSFCTGASNIIVYFVFNRRAASVFLAFLKLHRGSQVGIATAVEGSLSRTAMARRLRTKEPTDSNIFSLYATGTGTATATATTSTLGQLLPDQITSSTCKEGPTPDRQSTSASHVTPTLSKTHHDQAVGGSVHSRPASTTAGACGERD